MDIKTQTFLNKHRLILLSIFLWSTLMASSFYLDISRFNEHSISDATQQARKDWEKSFDFIMWLTQHQEGHSPKINIAHLHPKLIEFLHSNIISTKNIQLYTSGMHEIITFKQILNEPYIELVKTIPLTKDCQNCHQRMGILINEKTAGLSTLLATKHFEISNIKARNQTLLNYFVIWLLGLITIIYIDQLKQVQLKEKAIAEKNLNRSEKMSTLGKLTGGIAHDYNNMLGVVLGYSELLANALKEQPKLAKYAQEIIKAGKRGASLTQKLLNFTRKKAGTELIVNINSLLLDQQQIIEKTLTVSIELVFDLAENLWLTSLDPNDFEDSILNLCINSHHAMGASGKLTIHTMNYRSSDEDLTILNLDKGEYILLSITDTGSGMDSDTQTKIFEPFYTTKGKKGTGLGLSQVYGFVQRSSGIIHLTSKLGVGTQFLIYIPRVTDTTTIDLIQEERMSSSIRGNESILIVDDEPSLVNLAEVILREHGYNVFCAESANEALKILGKESIDLLLSDVIMPHMDGYQLAALVHKQYPSIKIQLASGFSESAKIDFIDSDLDSNILEKPYEAEELLSVIRERLDTKEMRQQELDIIPSSNKPIKHFQWNDDLSIGIPQIDLDHKMQVTLLNRSITSLNKRGQNFEEFKNILDKLVEYTQYHFQREELVMKTCQYPKLADHKKEHTLLICELSAHIKADEFNKSSADMLVTFLTNWLLEHISGSDKHIAPFCIGKEQEIELVLQDAS